MCKVYDAPINNATASAPADQSGRLQDLFGSLTKLITEKRTGKQGLFTVVVNYLEDFSGFPDEAARAFFRDVNGLLRQHPMLIVWPVTQKHEALKMLDLASAVSGTVFANPPILDFAGPRVTDFPRIAKTTIATLNPINSLEDFQLLDTDFDEMLNRLQEKYAHEQTIRNYLRAVKSEWEQRSGQVEKVLALIPRFTEVWFVVCYPEAESVVSQFARKSDDNSLAWDAKLDKFSEYLGGQKAADWNPKRLLYALQGFFRTKVMYLPTHSLVACVAAFGNEKRSSGSPLVDPQLYDAVCKALPTEAWRHQSKAIHSHPTGFKEKLECPV